MKSCPKCFTEVEEFSRFCPNCGGSIPVDKKEKGDPFIGTTLVGKFLFKKRIGSGAMGSIYKAEQINLGKDVCIKILHSHLVGDSSLSARFHREAKAASRLKHPNCINVIDFGVAEGAIHYIAMDYLEGRDLANVIAKEFPLDPIRTLKITEQICAALDEAHSQGIIHRDLKPENVMIEDRRQQKDFATVLDFGIAKIHSPGEEKKETFHTMAGVVCGTPEYMSPEQGRGDELDARSDLYALGVILYHMTTGKLPFTAETPIGIVTKHLTEKPVPPKELTPGIDPELHDIIMNLLSKRREERLESAMAVKRRLEAIRQRMEQGGAAPASEDRAPTRIDQVADTEVFESSQSMKAAGKSKLMFVGMIGLGVLLLGGGAYFVLGGKKQAEEPAATQELVAQPAAPVPVTAPPAPVAQPAPAKAEENEAEADVVEEPVDEKAPFRSELQAMKLRLKKSKDELARRHMALQELKADDRAGETADTLSRMTVFEGNLDLFESRIDSLEKEEIQKTIGRFGEELSAFERTSSELLLKRLPSADEVASEKRRAEVLDNTKFQMDGLSRKIADLDGAVGSKSGDWKKAEREDKVEEFTKIGQKIQTLKADMETFRNHMEMASEDELTKTFAGLSATYEGLNAEVQKLVSEPVVSKADLEQQQKKEEAVKKWEAAKKAKTKAEGVAAQPQQQQASGGAAAEDDQRAKTLADQADGLFSSGRYAAAIGLYSQSLRIKDRTDVHLNLGKAYNAVGNFSAGAKHLNIYLQRMAGKLPSYKVELIKRQIRE